MGPLYPLGCPVIQSQMFLRSLTDFRISVEGDCWPPLDWWALRAKRIITTRGLTFWAMLAIIFHPLGSFENPNYKSFRSNPFPTQLPWKHHSCSESSDGMLVGSGRGRVQLQPYSGLFYLCWPSSRLPKGFIFSTFLILGLCFSTPTDSETQLAASLQLKCFLMASTQRFTLSQLTLKPFHKNAFCKQICFIIVRPESAWSNKQLQTPSNLLWH